MTSFQIDIVLHVKAVR